MGFYAGLAAEKYDRQYSNRRLFDRIFAYLKPFKRQTLLLTFVVILRSFTEALPALVIARLLDLVETSTDKLVVILSITGLILVLEIGSYLLNYVRRRQMIRVISELNRNLSADAFAASIHQNLAFHDLFSSGKIVSRVTSDTREFGTLINLTADVISQLIQSITIAVILLSTEFRMALVVLILIPIITIFMILYRRSARKVTRAGMRAMADVNATIKETVSGIAVAKNFRQEQSTFNIFNEANQVSYKVNVHRGLILSIVFPIMRTFGGIMIAVLVYFGAVSITTGLISIGAWYMFLLSLDRFLMPVFNIASYWTQVQAGLSSAERIFALIDADHSVKQTGNLVVHSVQGKIDFDQVYFGYQNNELLLYDFNLHIKPGESVAIVGHTGAGKTSIIRLISRFYEFQQGKIQVDDRDIRQYNLEVLRSKMGIVSQVPFLFDGSVIENICYTNQGITRLEIEELAHNIGGGDWVDTLPEGLDTIVGERGAKLSMGQRQLVALMRVLVQKPAIFILDEATASIDPFTERQIQIALNLILKNSTSILIAHRLSTVRSADRIIVMKTGSIIEEGGHLALLAQGGHYAELYNAYFRHQSLQYVENARKLLQPDDYPVLQT